METVLTRIWSHRPQFLHLALFFAAYVLGCGFAQLLAIVPGTGISIWPPSGLFIATLVLAARPSWPWWVLAGCLAELVGNVLWFHSPLPAALLIYTGNALEAAVGAWLVNRTCKRPVRLETLREVLAFVVLAAGIAPVVSATVGSATLAWFGIQSQTFAAAWPLLWIGDATGVLIVAPLALVVFQNWRGKARLSTARWIEAGVLGLIFLGVAALSLSGYLPFAYMIMPPLLWAAVRFEFKGAAIALALLALITAVFTITGASQFAGDAESQKQKQIMLHLFLAISAFSALVVAAISRQHQLAVLTLRKSERQLQQMIDAVPVRIWSTTPAGGPVYFNKRYQDYFRSVIPNFEALGEPRIETLVQELIHPEDAAGVQRTLQDCFETGRGSVMRFRWREKDGVYRWAECRVEPRRDQDGKVVEWYGVSIDIDEEVRANEALRQSERRYRHLFHYMPIGLTQIDASKLIPLFKELRAQGVTDLRTYIDEHPEFLPRALDDLEVEEVNQHIVEMFGAKNAEEMHGPITRYWQPGLSTIRRSIEARYRGEEIFQEETKVARMDGSVMDVLFTTARPGAISDKSLVSFIDITERKKAEAALRIRERELSQLVDMVPNHVWRLTPDGEPTFYNRRLIDFLGLDVVDVGKPGMTRLASAIGGLVHPDDAAGLGEALEQSFATGKPFSMKYRMRRADGMYRWLESRAEPLRDDSGAIVQWFGANVDIDDLMAAQAALREREAKVRRLVDSDIIGIVIWDLDGRLIDANDAFLRMVQYDREDLQAGLRWFDMTPPEWQGVHARYEAEELKTTGRMQAREKEYFRKDGSRVPVLIGAACFEGQSRQGVAYILDLSERKRAEEAVRQSERRLLELVETLPALIFCSTPSGEPTYRSRQLREYLGFDVQEKEDPKGSRLAGTLNAAIPPEELATVNERYGHSLRTGEPYALKHRLRRADGEYRWMETRAAAMRNAEGAIVQWNGICLDIEDQVRAQEKLRLAQENLARASQATSLAELSASIAHEVNQPLAAVVANSHACQRWLMATPPNIERAQKTVERIIRDANSAADVVGRIRALFSQSAKERNSAALGSVIAEARNLMAEEAARRRVRMEVDVESNLPLVAFDRVQVQQVLINLIRNGMDAMDSTAGDRVLGMRARRMGDVVQTEISDRGRGVAFPDKVFEPFFTTKENGMGMGLAICRSIVESHGGRLWAEKNEPRGATFIFTLPVEVKTVS